MIARIWRGRTGEAKADQYGDFLQRTAHPDYGGIAGNRGWLLLRRPVDGAVEFAFVSFWDSVEALQSYTGSDAQQPKYYPEDREALLELPRAADNYEILDSKLSF